jgi:hypothetical protein
MRSVSKAPALAVFAGLIALLVPGRAAAGDPPTITNYGENETPRSAGMGGALRALGNGTSGVFLNPAALPETRAYHIEALTAFSPETRRWALGGTVVDSVTSRLAGSFSIMGTPIAMDPNGLNRSFLDLRLALAYPITERFMIGLTGRYLKVTQSGLGPFGQSRVSGGLEDTSTLAQQAMDGKPPDRFALVSSFTFDAGLLVKASDNIYIAGVGQNLTYPRNGFLPTVAGGGVGFNNEFLSIEVDALADFNSWATGAAAHPTARIMAGAEYTAGGIVPIRAGYRFDQGSKLSTVSLGTGYVSSVFAIEASVKRGIASNENGGITTILFSAAYFLESSGLTRAAPTSPQGMDPVQ